MKKTGIGWAERNAFAALGLFFFVFLETEYLFDGRMALFVDSAGVVKVKSPVLRKYLYREAPFCEARKSLSWNS